VLKSLPKLTILSNKEEYKMGKAKHLGKGAILLGSIIAKVVWDQVKDTEFVKEKREQINEWAGLQQRKLQTKLQVLEDEFWEWIKQIEKEAGKNPNVVRDHDMTISQACRILDIPTSADLEMAKNAWKQKMKACHPDLFSNASDTEKQQAHQQAQKVNSAFQFLKNHYQKQS
jgi:hypothetical protein